MTTSGVTPRATSSGSTSAQLPTSPTETAVARPRRAPHPLQSLVQVVGHAVAVAGLDAPPDALRVDLHAQDGPLVHGGGERLGSTHAAHPPGQHPFAAQRRPEVLAGERAEGLVGALQDALGADVDPRSRGHLTEHDEAAPLQLPEVFPGRPVADQVGVCDEHPRRLRRGCGTLPPAFRTGRAASRRRQGRAACARWRRRRPRSAPPCRCRRTPPGRRGLRRPRDRGCS